MIIPPTLLQMGYQVKTDAQFFIFAEVINKKFPACKCQQPSSLFKIHFSSKFHLLDCGVHLLVKDTKYKNTSCAGVYRFLSRCCLGQLKLITRLSDPISVIKIYTTLPVTFPLLPSQIFLFLKLLSNLEETFKLLP